MNQVKTEPFPTVFKWYLLPASSLKAGMFLVDKDNPSKVTVVKRDAYIDNRLLVHIHTADNPMFCASIKAIFCVARVGEA